MEIIVIKVKTNKIKKKGKYIIINSKKYIIIIYYIIINHLGLEMSQKEELYMIY